MGETNQISKREVISILKTIKTQVPKLNIPFKNALKSLFAVILFFGYRIYLFKNKCYALHEKYKLAYVKESYFGLYKDVSDSQWVDFSSALDLIFLYAVFFLSASGILKVLCNKYSWDVIYLQFINVLKRGKVLCWFYLLTGLCFITYLFNVGLIFWLFFTWIFFLSQKFLVTFKFYPLILWAGVVLILYTNEKYQGYSFEMIHPSFKVLDEIRREYAELRWQIIFNMTILRMVSFCLDKHWMIFKKYEPLVKDQLTLKARVAQHQPITEFTLLNYYAYLVYSPLYISGPQVTFNAFISQVRKPQNQYSNKQIIVYLFRVLFMNLLAFEVYQHINFSNALSKIKSNQAAWADLSLMDFYEMSFFNLIFIWFKFLNIWRVARVWALIDGIESPENMNRCICNNYCFQGFWRSWHRGFNQWLVRYLFIPLGGSKFKVLNIWIVFGFVAIWHDFNLNLILWAWVICLALVPEIMIQNYFQSKIQYWKKWWWKHVCSFGGTFQVLLMIFANVIGFGAGWETTSLILEKFWTYEGIKVIFIEGFFIFQCTKFMFYLRERDQMTEY